ncbi:MAG: bi-domain-containing oxidoreductase [Candidatus Delongbacteria bacterium]|nr:bi-domain-containing oxidoreductase [Candidatus Delongbacteria bacterium]
MKQVAVLNNNRIDIVELPAPTCGENEVLVRTAFSVISAGTETGSLEKNQERDSLLKYVLNHPDLIRRGIRVLKQSGFRALRRKVDAVEKIQRGTGYSLAGVVEAVGSEVIGFQPGDRVAAGGSGIAQHAEFCSVPVNLVVKVPESVTLEQASLTTVASIALQGIRQAEVGLGDQVVVIGLGLLGVLTAKFVEAAGGHVVGIDLDPRRLENFIAFGFPNSFLADEDRVEEKVLRITGPEGADCTILTAATSSDEPVNQALRLTRKRGKVVVVGDVGMNISRAFFYKKEIDFRISCSYGPGRYDPEYEELGIDYPFAYVRWTENRNMQAYLDLLVAGRIRVDDLLTHRFTLEEAQRGFQLLLDSKGSAYGVILQYDAAADSRQTVTGKIGTQETPSVTPDGRTFGIIGMGGFVTRTYVDYILATPELNIRGVANRTPFSSGKAAEIAGAQFATTDYREILKDHRIGAVIIGTHHDTHAEIAREALAAGKHVMVEKPVAITLDELQELSQAVKQAGTLFAVGTNRRYSPFLKRIKSAVSGPLMINYRVNAGHIPPGHWTQDSKVGGGRLVGEGVHFIDVCNYLCSAEPVSWRLQMIPVGNTIQSEDNYSLQLTYPDNSLAVIDYICIGAKNLGKEYLEVHSQGESFLMYDYLKLVHFTGSKCKDFSLKEQDKGQREQFHQFCLAINGREHELITPDASLLSTRIALEAWKEWKDA